MLDTPVPIRGHFTTLIAQNPPVVERYISTLWGHVTLELLGVQPGPYYVRSPLGTIASWFRFGLDGHALAHRWYRRTILQRSTDDPSLDSYGTNAFSLSPLLGGYQIINHSSEQTAMTRFEPASKTLPLAVSRRLGM